jgi:predicted RNase H-like nuclease (RuvC/YqgF family)
MSPLSRLGCARPFKLSKARRRWSPRSAPTVSALTSQIKQLEAEKKDLERQIQDLKAKCEAIEKRESERRALDEKKHAEEVQFLKRTNQQLKQQLETILAPSQQAAKK